MPVKTWTAAEINQAAKLWKDGLSLNDIADALGRGHESVKHQTRKNRAKFPRRRQQRNSIQHATRMSFVVPKYTYKKMKSEAKARGMSINMLVREMLQDRFVRGLWKPDLKSKPKIEKKPYYNGSQEDTNTSAQIGTT